MIDFKEMIENETVEDVLLQFALIRSYPDIDNMYVRYKFEVIAEGVLLNCYKKLVKEGMLAKNEKGWPVKGPNWKEPKFVTEKKYGIT